MNKLTFSKIYMIKMLLLLSTFCFCLPTTALAQAKPTPTPSPIIAELRPQLRVTSTGNNDLTGTISWNEIATTRYYAILPAESALPSNASDLELIEPQNLTTEVANISKNSQFRVLAIDSAGKIIAAGLTTPADRALASTEFGLLSNLTEYVKKLMVYALPLAIILSVLMTIYAGILMMFFAGADEKVKEAKEIIQGAVIGLSIILLSRLFVDFLLLPNTDFNQLPPNTNFIETSI